MITNYFKPPHPALTSFVDDYTLCTSGDNTIIFGGPWPASNETSLVFYLADKPGIHKDTSADSIIANKDNCIVGLLTHCNGTVHFEGNYHTFIIQFKANGFNKIFRMPMHEFTDKIFTTEDVFGSQTAELYEQLLNAKNIQQMAFFADRFLLPFLNRQNRSAIMYDGITSVATHLYNTTTFLSVEQYAHKANMSLRNFGRQFKEQAGVSPKLYTKLARFNQAVKIKTMHPAKNWTAIAYECNYYDQMHLIKDFKRFSGFSPSEFFYETGSTTFQRSNYPPLNEQFVFVKRTAI